MPCGRAPAFSERPGLRGPLLSRGCRRAADLSPQFLQTVRLQPLRRACPPAACRLPNKAAGSRPLSNPQGLAEGPRSAEVFTCLKMYQAINRSCSQSPAILGWFFPYFLPPFVSFNKEEREERGKQSPLSALFSEPQRARSRSFSQTLRQGAWAAGEEADCRGDTRLLEDPGAE